MGATAHQMTDEHKQALAKGRQQAKVVKAYLEALRSTKPARGRKRTTESIKTRLDKIEADLKVADPLHELLLTQDKANLEHELAHMGDQPDISGLEAEFVEVAAAYSAAKGIDFATWRKVGISAEVLKRAGISR